MALTDDWNEMARDSYQAANELFDSRRWRSAVSRAYYAAYAVATAAALRDGQSMPARGNPGHEQLQNMTLQGLHSLGHGHRSAAYAMLSTLFWLRVMADYGVGYRVDRSDAVNALGFMAGIFRSLKR